MQPRAMRIMLAFLMSGAVIAADPPRPVHPRIDLVPGYVVDAAWPADRPARPWDQMCGAAIDRKGNIWTLNRGEIPVQVYSPEGKLLKQWDKSIVKRGHQIRIDPAGNIWIPDLSLHVLFKISPEGKLLLTIGTPGEAGCDATRFYLPTDVAFAANGDLFISDGYGNNRVVHCDADGKFIKDWGKMGVAAGEFSLPHSIAIDSQGLVYVADRNNCRVQIFQPGGQYVGQWANLLSPWTIWRMDSDEFYLCGASPSHWNKDALLGIPPKDQVVMKVDRTGRVISWWNLPYQPEQGKEKPGELNWVHALAADAQGNLYLGDIKGSRIQKFLLTGGSK